MSSQAQKPFKSAIGANSRPLRYFVVTLVVTVYTTVGWLFHLTLNEYMLPGVPILVVFQLLIHKQPLRTTWVRSGPPLKLDLWFFTLWAALSLFPVYKLLRAVEQVDLVNTVHYVVVVAGAFAMAYGIRNMRVGNVRQLVFCIITVGAIGILPSLLSPLLPHILHLHLNTRGGQLGVAWTSFNHDCVLND